MTLEQTLTVFTFQKPSKYKNRMHLTGMHAIDHWYNSVLVSWRACMGHTKNAGECDSSMPRACCILVKWEGGRAVLFTYAVEVWKDSSMALSSPGLICPAAFKQFNHPLELSWSLALPPLPLIFPLVEPLEGDFQMQSITYGQSTPIPIKPHRNLYVLHFKHQGNRYPCRSLGGFEVMEHLRSSHHCNCCLDTRE